MNGPFLVRMDVAAFEDLPNKVVPRSQRLKDPSFQSHKSIEWIFEGYCDTFLFKNEKFQELLQQFAGRRDESEFLNHLTQGQRILYSLSTLNGQVSNGGVTQFFWNFPDLIFPTEEALIALKYSELLAAYVKAIERLVGEKDKWIELRNQANIDPANFCEPFRETYELLDLEWFDDDYYERFQEKLIDLIVSYVKDHKDEFIES